MTRFDFTITNDAQVDHDHFRCWKCVYFKPVGEFGPSEKIGACDQPSSSHYGHVLNCNHSICHEYAARDSNRFGWQPENANDEAPLRDDGSSTLRMPKNAG